MLGAVDVEGLSRAAEARCVPLTVLTVAEPDLSTLRELYRAAAVVIRPDHHVAWRGDQLPPDAGHVVDVITGMANWPVAIPR